MTATQSENNTPKVRDINLDSDSDSDSDWVMPGTDVSPKDVHNLGDVVWATGIYLVRYHKYKWFYRVVALGLGIILLTLFRNFFLLVRSDYVTYQSSLQWKGNFAGFLFKFVWDWLLKWANKAAYHVPGA